MDKSQPAVRNRLYSIDFLKYILAVLIIFHHYQQMTGVRYASFINFADGKIYFGFVSEFFFIISGFLAAFSIEKTMESDFGSYFLKKLKRIYPMAITATAFTALVLLAYPVIFGASYKGLVPSLWRLLNSLLITFAGGAVKDVDNAVNHPIWYLGVLVICYVIFWLILYKCRKEKGNPLYLFAGMCLIGVGILQYQINLPFLNEYAGRGYAAFFWGVILNYIYRRYNAKALGIISATVIIISVGLGIVSFDTFYDNVWGILVFLIFPAVMFVFLALNGIFEGKLWAELGEVSFEMYLWHGSFIILLSAILDGTGILESPVTMIIFAIFMTIVGFVIRRFLEKPVTALFSKL